MFTPLPLLPQPKGRPSSLPSNASTTPSSTLERSNKLSRTSRHDQQTSIDAETKRSGSSNTTISKRPTSSTRFKRARPVFRRWLGRKSPLLGRRRDGRWRCSGRGSGRLRADSPLLDFPSLLLFLRLPLPTLLLLVPLLSLLHLLQEEVLDEGARSLRGEEEHLRRPVPDRAGRIRKRRTRSWTTRIVRTESSATLLRRVGRERGVARLEGERRDLPRVSGEGRSESEGDRVVLPSFRLGLWFSLFIRRVLLSVLSFSLSLFLYLYSYPTSPSLSSSLLLV